MPQNPLKKLSNLAHCARTASPSRNARTRHRRSLTDFLLSVEDSQVSEEKKSFLHGLVSRKSFIRKYIDTSLSNFITSSFHLLFCFFISLKKRMFFRQARGSACKAVVAFYYYSSVRCLISKASINFFPISNPPKNARFSLFSLCFTQTACYFQSEEDKSAL